MNWRRWTFKFSITSEIPCETQIFQKTLYGVSPFWLPGTFGLAPELILKKKESNECLDLANLQCGDCALGFKETFHKILRNYTPKHFLK